MSPRFLACTTGRKATCRLRKGGSQAPSRWRVGWALGSEVASMRGPTGPSSRSKRPCGLEGRDLDQVLHLGAITVEMVHRAMGPSKES